MLLSFACFFSCQSTDKNSNTTEVDGANIYSTSCAGCHGQELQGGSAGPLKKEDWQFGETRSLLVRNVTHGIPGTEMAPFKEMLSKEEIRGVVDFIIDSQGSAFAAPRELPEILETEDYSIRIETVVDSIIETPWSIEFISDREALVSEKTGRIRWIKDGVLSDPIQGTPPTHLGSSTGGYMDMALDPEYSLNGWIYLSFSHSNGRHEDREAPATTKIVRAKIEDGQWVEEQSVFEVPDSLWVSKGNRWGCRLLFDQQGKLLFSIGDMGQAMDSQDLGKATGKMYRINTDGTIPSDNPFVDSVGALPAIYSLGNRNVQGLDIHPQTGEIWASEHGPMGGDELNILNPGHNYGWPIITYGLDYDGSVVSTKTHYQGMRQPIHTWTPSTGVCPITFVPANSLFKKWSGNNLLIGSLAFADLRRYVIKGRSITKMETLFKGFGRVRDIKAALDGSIYVVLNNPDKIIRLSPMEPS